MKYMTSNEIRETFLKFFEDKQHRRVPSASLIPANDPTLLFTNAGMVPFKDCFLGAEKRDYVRATSSQRCVRAGGKHNDLDNVGYTARHHTFFEMLGNFSFGDYFKEDAIRFAWQFLTETLGLPKEKLWVTVFHDDKEAEDIWFNKIGIDQTRFSRLGEKDNFWAMGDTGPCGPCSEIFYDHGPDVAGGPPGSPEEDGDRYIEIWNLVFMQFNRHQDGTMEPLPKPSVDTGMGLERIAAVMQNVHSNYEIDLFSDLIKDIAQLLNVADIDNKSLRVIADHIRSTAFLIIDGVVPSNEGRGYVLRRIMRRAIRHGHKLGATNSFFYKVAASLAKLMGQAYPELNDKLSIIQQTIEREEEQFARTLDNGMKILEQDLANLNGDTVSGETVFTLYDTYGFPVDLTADIARERQLTIDEAGFNELMRMQRERSQAAGQFGKDYNADLNLEHSTEFVGYDALENRNTILQLVKGDTSVSDCATGDEAILVTDKTAFYAESGGQVGDRGEIITETGRAQVLDTNKVNQAFAHRIKVVEGNISEGQSAEFKVDASLRSTTAIHHSATHLIHAALREVLGEHVTQKGSLVDEHKLRFDFSHPEAVTAEELAKVEARVNEEILKNHSVTAAVMSMDEAKEQGAMALFGEKYGDEVRVLKMGDFSIELCGGTHVARTGDIGLFKIVSEQGIASGIRRIEAVGGMVALRLVQQQDAMVRTVAAKLKTDPASLGEKVDALLTKTKELEKNIEQLNSKLAASQGDELVNSAVTINGIKVIATELSGVDPKSLRDLMDQMKNKLQSGVVALGLNNGGKANLIVGVTQDLTKTLKAGDLVKAMAEQVGGKGGGRPDMAQAGGPDAANIDKAIAAAVEFVTERTN